MTMNNDSDTFIMEETSISEWKCKYHEHSSKFGTPNLSEQTLTSEALDKIDYSAFNLLRNRPRDHKAGGNVSATLAPPIWSGEDNGVATTCKRIKSNLGKPTTHYHSNALDIPADAITVSAGNVATGPGARTLDGAPVKLGVDRDAREKSALSGQGDVPQKRASGWKSYGRYRRSSSSSFPDYGSPTPKGTQTVINKNSMVVGEGRTIGVPGGPFRPRNTLQRTQSGSSSVPRPNQKKIFNLRDGEFTISGEHRVVKRRKIDPQRTIQNDSSSNVIDLSESHNRLDAARSLSPKGSGPQQSGVSKVNHEHANLFQVGEYRRVEAIMSFDRSYRSSKTSEAESVRRRSSGESRSVRKIKNAGEKRDSISLEAVEAEEIEEASLKPKRHQSTANGSVSRPKAVWTDLNSPVNPEQPSVALERSPYFIKQNRQIGADTDSMQLKLSNGHITSPVLVETLVPNRDLSKSRTTHNALEEAQYLEEDSVDLLKVDGGDSDDVLLREDGKAGYDTFSSGDLARASALPNSESLSNEGDIPRSALARAKDKSSRKQTRGLSKPKISFNIEYIRTGQACFELQKGCVPWQFQFDYDRNEFDLFGTGDSITEKSPGLVLKPGNIHRIIYNSESEKVVIRRAAEVGTGASGVLLLKIQSSSDVGRLVHCLKRLNSTIRDEDMTSERLDKVFANEIKAQTSVKTRIKSRKSEEISLLEANETRRATTTKPSVEVRIGFKTSAQKQEQPINVRRKHSLAIEEDTSAAQPRRPLLARKMTTTFPQDDETYDHSSGTRLHGSEVSGVRRTVKQMENVNDFRPITRASAHQEIGYPQLRTFKSRSPSPPRWTKENPRWQEEKCWKTSLIYPAEGKQRATVDARDVERLDEGEFLNDNLIAFFFRYLEVQLEKSHPDSPKRIYFKNTFFYETLTKGKIRGNDINYDAVKRWTNKVDIFSYDYIVVPVCEKFHWYVAIICNAPKLLYPSIEVDKGLHEDEVAIVNVTHKPAKSLKTQKDDSVLSNPPPENRHENSVVEHSENSLRTNSASPSVTTQVEHMSLDDGKDEWPEPDAPPQQRTSSAAVEQNFGSAEEFIEHLKSKDSVEKEVGTSDILRKSKKLKRKSMPPTRRYDPREPRIITLDSLGGTHSPTCSNLRAYLVCEAKERKNVDITPGSLGMTATGLPQQSNYCDCGVFILGYVKKFLEDPDTFVRSILQKDADQIRDWSEMDAAKMRETIRQLIFRLHDEQTRRENEQRGIRYKAKKASKNETKHGTTMAPDTGSLPRLSTTEVTSKTNTSEPDDPISSHAPSPSIDVGDCKNARHHTPEAEISALALVDVQLLSTSPIEKPSLRNHTKRKRSTHNADTATTNANYSPDVEVIETPAPNFRRHEESSKRRLDFIDTSPLRTPVRRRISAVNLDTPLDPARFRDNVFDEFSSGTGGKVTKSNIFKEFAKNSTSPYENTRRRTGFFVLDEHTTVEIEDSKDTHEPEIHETPPRTLEREGSFEDILEIQDSDSPSTPPRRGTKGLATLIRSPPIISSKSSPRTLRSSPRDSERLVTLFESPKYRREIRRTAKN